MLHTQKDIRPTVQKDKERKGGLGNDLLALVNLTKTSAKVSLAVTDQSLSSLGNQPQERARAALLMGCSSLALKGSIPYALRQTIFDSQVSHSNPRY